LKTKKLATISIVAATYTVISLILSPISYTSIQVRIAEGLNLLALYIPESSFGIVLGCLLTNLIGVMNGTNVLGFSDVLVGTCASAISVYLIRKIGPKKNIVVTMFVPVVVNAIVIGLELTILLYPQNFITGLIICMCQVGLGEIVSMYIGLVVIKELRKRNII